MKDYPNSQYQQYALRRSAEAALASFAGVEYDDAALIEAEERYRDYLAQYGAMAQREGVDLIIENIRERRAEKLFVIGEYYERTNHLSSAVHSYRMVAATWPDTVAAGKAGATNAALAAVQILATGDGKLRRKLKAHRVRMEKSIVQKNEKLAKLGIEEYVRDKDAAR